MYGKIFATMYEGSLAGSGPTVFALFGYCIAKADPDTHCVMLNPTVLSAIIGTTPEEINKAIAFLESPDEKSKNKDRDGRRIVNDSGFSYFVVSHEHYRNIKNNADRCAYERERKRKQREKNETIVPIVPECPGQSGTPVSVSVSDSDKDVNTNKDDTHNLIRADWKESKAEYDRIVKEAAERVKADTVFCSEMERLHQNIDCDASIDAALIYWLNDAVYEHLRRKRTKTIRPESWFRINFAKNKIYKRREYAGRSIGADRRNPASSYRCVGAASRHRRRSIPGKRFSWEPPPTAGALVYRVQNVGYSAISPKSARPSKRACTSSTRR